jgi:hypothetical protein
MATSVSPKLIVMPVITPSHLDDRSQIGAWCRDVVSRVVALAG